MWEAETDIFAIQWSSLSVLVWLDKSYQIFYHIPFDLLLSSLFGVRSKEGEGNGTGINPFLLRVLLNNPRHRNQKKFRPTPSTPPSASFSLNFICFLFSLCTLILPSFCLCWCDFSFEHLLTLLRKNELFENPV